MTEIIFLKDKKDVSGNMPEDNVRHQTMTNLIWRFAERIGAQGVGLIVSIILARLLEPSDYGNIALVSVFIGILQVFVDSGLGSALIQKKDADDIDFSTVFFCNICFCGLLYIALFFAAPLIAKFYDDASLTPIVRVAGLTIVLSGVKNVQQAYVSRKLLFRRFFFATLGGTIGAAILGIFMAYHGFGVWALVAQQLFNTLVDTIILWVTVKWRPRRMFSFSRLKRLFSFGSRMLLATIISTIYGDVRQLLIGKVYSSEDLAYYNRGGQYPNLLLSNVSSSINSVLFPVMANFQGERERLKAATKRSIRITGYIVWPCMFGLMAVSKPLITLLMTKKWLPCIPYLYIFCLVCGLDPIQQADLNLIKAMGKSDMTLRMEIIKKTIGVILILLTFKISVMALALSSLVYALIVTMINLYPSKKLLNYTYTEQWKDILPSFGMSFLMWCIVYPISFIGLPDVLTIVLQVTVGIAVYLGLSAMFKSEDYEYVKSMVEDFFEKKRQIRQKKGNEQS